MKDIPCVPPYKGIQGPVKQGVYRGDTGKYLVWGEGELTSPVNQHRCNTLGAVHLDIHTGQTLRRELHLNREGAL